MRYNTVGRIVVCVVSILGLLLNLLVAEKSGFAIGSVEQTDLKAFSDRMAREMIESMSKEETPAATPQRTASNGK